MPPMGWVAIAVALFTAVFGVVFWLVQRRVTRLDALEAAVFGEHGVRHALKGFVTHEALDRKLEGVNAALKGISEEGERREERIVNAIRAHIDNQTLVIGSEVRELKTDLRDQARRIDYIIEGRTGGR